MPSCCKYLKLNGQACGRNHGAKFEFCANHRPRDAVRQFNHCATCGTQTRLTSARTGLPLCAQQSCGMYQHQVDLKRKHRAEAAEQARKAKQDAEEARNQDICASVLDDYVADLVESFDASTVRPVPPPPPAAWRALTPETQSELTLWIRQAIEADRRDAHVAPAAAISSH
jgi:hypothetical protein